MAEKSEEQPKDDLLLVAHVRARLLGGEVIDLLPFKHETDVRGEVNRFIEDWVKTGFLLKQNLLYPWHQVQRVEVVSVQILNPEQAQPYLEVWKLDTDGQKDFWKTRQPQGKKDGEKEGGAH
ncbi:hypothetical protein ACPOL_2221 [Acidisarcina polymorpha]|uniref:Uncharacterized protein n=1 Tax=Acidisarcina polymorpha TaxID=2211140 RepID=A0A2Z5FYQ3_9BACT|nr:hypothetical protein [Acidisarcina polymorpha]AXC11545.1 hypothetical protein ACPOL_2221 [Acidisarcina polymorpha]